MTDRELMQQALDALVRMHSYGDVFRYQNWQANPYEQVRDAVIALRERLAQQESEPFEYWNAVEGWVKIDEVREHFDSVGCGTIYKTAGEDRVPLYTAPPQRKPLTEQEPVAWRFRETKNKQWSISDDGYYISCKRTSGYIIEPLYTTPPQRKPLTDDEIGLLTTDPRFAHIETPTLAEFARAVIAKATGEKA